jgi:hypothetical protein
VVDDGGMALAGVGISMDGMRVAYTDSNGAYIYTYTVDSKVQQRLFRAELGDFEPAEARVTLTSQPQTISLVLKRPLAAILVTVTDSLTSAPISGVDVFLGNEKIDTTGADGRLTITSQRIFLHDTSVLRFEKKKYKAHLEYVAVEAREQPVMVLMIAATAAAPAPRLESPRAYDFFAKEVLPKEPPPRRPEQVQTQQADAGQIEPQPELTIVDQGRPEADITPLPEHTAREDSALMYMLGGEYRQAMDIYLELVAQRRWTARPDFWLYVADCALHTAGGENAVFNESVIDSALQFLDQAELYQNRIEQDIFPAVVQLKKGEAWAYKCKLPTSHNTARLQEYRQKARFYLRSAITQMRNGNYTETDFYRYALLIRDEIENY